MSKMIKKSLHEILLKPISGSRPKGGVSLVGDIPSLGGENITMNGEISFYPVKKITTEFFESMKRGHLKDLDVLINKDGANTGKSSIYRKSPFPKATINEHLFILRGIEDKLDQEYLHYLIQSSSVKKILETKIAGSAQPGLNSTFVQNFPVEITSLPEQKKIASILTSIDAMIEKIQLQINKHQDLKKGTINELLTKGIGHTEFKESELGRIPKSWEVKPLDELVSKITDGEHLSPNLVSAGKPILSAKHIREDGVQISEAMFVSHKDFQKMLKRCNPEFNDVLIVSRGATIGRITICNIKKSFALMGSVILIKPSVEKVLGVFISLFFQQEIVQTNLLKLSGSSAQQAIYLKDIKTLKLPIPLVAEQRKITNVISAIDLRKKNLNKKLMKLRYLKKSLMQDLLTGKISASIN